MIHSMSFPQSDIEELIEAHALKMFPPPAGSTVKVKIKQARAGKGGPISYTADVTIDIPFRPKSDRSGTSDPTPNPGA